MSRSKTLLSVWMSVYVQYVDLVALWHKQCASAFNRRIGVARILLRGGGTGAWRTGSEVRCDKLIQKWKPSGVRSAKTNMAEVFATAACHSNWWLWRSNFELTELARKISTSIVWTAAKFACIRKLQWWGARAPVPHDWRCQCVRHCWFQYYYCMSDRPIVHGYWENAIGAIY